MLLFDVKTQYRFINDHGSDKTVRPIWVINALSITEALTETFKLSEELGGISDFDIINIGNSKYSECLKSDTSDYFYSAKVSFSTVDEISGKERKSKMRYLVPAGNIDQSKELINEYLKEVLIPWELEELKLSTVKEVYINDQN